MTSRLVPALFVLVASICVAGPSIAAPSGIKCKTNVVACLKKAFKRCPKNVTFIQDRNMKLGMQVLPRGTPLTEANIKGRPTYTVCTPK
ncbi:hypothetical protein [Rhizobium sp.]